LHRSVGELGVGFSNALPVAAHGRRSGERSLTKSQARDVLFKFDANSPAETPPWEEVLYRALKDFELDLGDRRERARCAAGAASKLAAFTV